MYPVEPTGLGTVQDHAEYDAVVGKRPLDYQILGVNACVKDTFAELSPQ
jgi:hypothetical protein